MSNSILTVDWSNIVVLKINEKDYISLTDIAKKKNSESPADIIKNWLRNKTSLKVKLEQMHF